jgi:hypothetical protein
MELEVVIEGVTNIRLEKAIKRRIREVCANAPRGGWWSVFVAPSETRGEWDLALRSSAGRRVASFVGQDDRLPDLVGTQLKKWF